MVRARRARGLVVAILAFTAGCADLEGVLADATPPDADRAARRMITDFDEGDFAAIEAQLHPSIAGDQTNMVMRALVDSMASYALGEPRLIGSRWGSNGSLRYRELLYEVPMTLTIDESVRGFDPTSLATTRPRRLFLQATVTLVDEPGDYRVVGFHVRSAHLSQAQINGFTRNLRPPQVLFLVLMAGAVAFQVLAIARVVRSSLPRKWLWVPLALVGVTRVGIVWTTGATSFHAFAVHIPVIGYRQEIVDGPLFLLFAFPAGAFWVLEVVRRHERRTRARERPPTVVFVCEFGSKKSVLAAAYFNHAADARDLPVRAIACGLNPDAAIPENIQATLRDANVEFDDDPPTRFVAGELRSARMVVTFADAPLSDMSEDVEVRNWADVPPLSGAFDRVRDRIRHRAEALVEELAARDAPAPVAGEAPTPVAGDKAEPAPVDTAERS